MILYKDNTPVVSIILPAYNREKLLPRAINSVLTQSFNSWELIVIDDGSSDNTFSVVKAYQEKYPYIKYVRHSHRKLPFTMNTGLMLAIGKFVTFLGSDDLYKPDHLELRVSKLENDETIQFLHGGVEVIGNPYVKDKNDLTKLIHLDDCVIGGTFFGYREIFLENNGFNNIDYSEDSEFFERISGKYNIVKVSYPTYVYYRDTPDSIVSNI